ncbi:LacI family DNA-binding transcriptional regulator [uncultured Deinococcus sp.]|uniref:LacI family DNA-binding transcriptional regulator n=1 Tax=uncultured Deinococcus sp. TaxID=158789 RepID=UPI002584EF1F|nr:LacI family DNA-binding transcriptional regulator [uncultured Deinococcus sp.]
MLPKSAVTLVQVAREAGVSTATVSFVVNGTKPVSAAVEERVRTAIRTLGYQPSHTAQALRTGKSATLGLLIPDLTNPFFPKLAQSIEQEARRRGYAVLLSDSHDDPALQAEALTTFARRGVDALLVVPAVGTAQRLRTRLPLILIDREVGGHATVQSDKVQGGQLAAAHLMALGHHEVAVLAGPGRQGEPGARVQGMLAEMRRAGAGLPASALHYSGYGVEDGRAGAHALLDAHPETTALLAANDTLALGALSAAQSRGLRVPGDLSLVGFDDIFWAALSSPPLTTVRQDTQALARLAVEQALSGHAPAPLARIPTELIVRGSTGPAPHRRSP